MKKKIYTLDGTQLTITEGTGNKIIGRISDDGTITEGTSNKIIGRISDDGTITEGTSNKIIGRISDDGTITEGTSRRVVGKIDIEIDKPGDNGGLAILIGVFLLLFCIYFAIFQLPGVVYDIFTDMNERENQGGIITLSITLIITVASCILSNIMSSVGKKGFGNRIAQGYMLSALGCYLTIIIGSCFTNEFSLFILLAGLLVSALFPVLPTIIICPVFHLVEAVRKVLRAESISYKIIK